MQSGILHKAETQDLTCFVVSALIKVNQPEWIKKDMPSSICFSCNILQLFAAPICISNFDVIQIKLSYIPLLFFSSASCSDSLKYPLVG